TVASGSAYSPTHFSGAQSRSPNAVFAYGASVVSPRNSRYGLGTSTTSDVRGATAADGRGSAETVAKEIPVVEHDEERQRRHGCERVVQACAERPRTRAPHADREPSREQRERNREQRDGQRDVQRRRNLVDQVLEAAREDQADCDDEQQQQ